MVVTAPSESAKGDAVALEQPLAKHPVALAHAWLAAFVAAVLVPRLAFVLLAPSFDGDARVYATVAQNILLHGCVSMSDPASGACVPHWGGNQLPGYPAFIALLWLLGDASPAAPLIGQTVAYAAAAAYLLWVLGRSGYSRPALAAAACVLAFSPTLVAWPRMMLTETLAVAASLWVLAALVRSLREQGLRVAELAVAAALGFFVRYDFVLVAIPVAIAALWIHSPAQALRRCALIAALVAMPVAIWGVRSVTAGLPPVPPFGLTATGAPVPPGVLGWMAGWISSQYELPHSVWPLVNGDYAAIAAPASAHANAGRMTRAEGLLAELSTHRGGPVPQDLDAEFAALAAEEAEARPLWRWIVLPAQRAANMWASPFPSMGWPAEMQAQRDALLKALRADGVAGVAGVAAQDRLSVMIKAMVAAWRYSVLVALVAVVVVGVATRRSFGPLLWLALTLVLLRTAAFSQTLLVESRYLLPAMAWLEVALAVVLVRRLRTAR